MKTRLATPAALVSLGLLAACSSDNAPEAGRVSLTVATTPAAVAKAGADTLSDGVNELVLSSVKLVLAKIELEAGDGAESDSTGVEEFEAGPLLVDLPLGGGTDQVVNVNLAPGTYDEVEFEVHSVSGDDPTEAAFEAAYPEMVGASIRAEGTFNGTPFVFVTDMDQEQESELNPPMVIDPAGGSVNLTLRIDPSLWFSDGSNGFVDPASANHNGPNEGLVKDNIENSFDTFEDDDHDGEED